ncbi:transposase, partial [Paludibacter sp. 221]|uniref:transposase n=1 Tax=Paludibacter sp. 221 TaxID=2302939 RepID=UPI0013D56520
MVKIQKLSSLTPTLGFSEFDFYSDYRSGFSSSALGQLYGAIPFSSLASRLGLRDSALGRSSYFSPEGKLALMFLKSYTGLSDSRLIDSLNSNIHYQLFCGVRIHPLAPLRNFKIVSQIRCEIASLLDIDSLQQVLASYWKPYMENLSVLMTDATCYESHLRYPTYIKLLWEAVDWLHTHMCAIYKEQGLRKPRTKYDKQALRYRSYSKSRNPRKSHRRVLQRSLLHLLNKLIGLTDQVLFNVHPNKNFTKRYAVIKQVYHQQRMFFEGKKVKHLIVSIDKSYIRPIVRGKETKAVEFGAKVNTIQVDGINFIEHLSFEAFNEGIRLVECVNKQQRLFHRRVKQIG